MSIKIQIDDREDKVIPFFKSTPEVEIEIKRLTRSDYAILINDQVLHAFERKASADLISSMKTDNLHIKELVELRAETGCKISFLVENKKVWYQPNTDVHGVPYKKVKALLDTIYLQYDLPIIYTKDYEDTANQLTLLAQRYHKLINEKGITFNIKGGSALLTSKKEKTQDQQVKKLWLAIPGVGPETADVLMYNYSIMDLMTVDVEEIQKLKVNNSVIGVRLDSIIKKIQGGVDVKGNDVVHKKILLAIDGVADQKAIRILNQYAFRELSTAKLEDMTFNNRKLGKIGTRIKELLVYHPSSQ